VGPARAADSYLDHEAVIEAARKANADAIHPGYGFLAENAEFAGKVQDVEGITWVGPSSNAMESLGEKTKARTIMQEADVPIVPGTTDPVTQPEEVKEFGEKHGYPIAIKAEGGGGGRGMKVVWDESEVEDQLESAQREGEAYFDNDSVYLERYLEKPRHIEVQIVADQHGNVRHLGERDCSLQRRHQKVIEEGPSAALSDELREKIGEAARRGVAAADYTNAGTVEFLVEEEPGRDGVLGRTRTSTSSRSTRGSRSNTQSPRRSRASTSSNDSSKSPPARNSTLHRTTSRSTVTRSSSGSTPRTRPTTSRPRPVGPSRPTTRRAELAFAWTTRSVRATNSSPTTTR